MCSIGEDVQYESVTSSVQVRIGSPGEPKSSGHVTVAHQMLASTFRAFRAGSLFRPDKKCEEICARLF